MYSTHHMTILVICVTQRVPIPRQLYEAVRVDDARVTDIIPGI